MKEIWKDIPGYEGLYVISNRGRIYSLLTNKIRADVKSGNGYRAVQLSDVNHKKKRYYVHRLVALTFLGVPKNQTDEVNHKNLDKTDNRVENLEWVSHDENYRHAYKNGKTDYRRPIRCDNKTGIKGVYHHGNHYAVCLCGNYVGYYSDLETAAFARWDAEREFYASN